MVLRGFTTQVSNEPIDGRTSPKAEVDVNSSCTGATIARPKAPDPAMGWPGIVVW
jgi:hypothetical protein